MLGASLIYPMFAMVVLSIVVALTFHPALLMALGDRVDSLRVPWIGRRVAGSMGEEGRFWGGAVRAVVAGGRIRDHDPSVVGYLEDTSDEVIEA